MNNDSFNSGNIELGSAENQRSAFIFYYSVMPLYQIVEKNRNIAKRNFLGFACFFDWAYKCKTFWKKRCFFCILLLIFLRNSFSFKCLRIFSRP
jgi:hypothetical protein